MKREKYFERLLETSKEVHPIIAKAYESYIQNGDMSSTLLPPFADKRLKEDAMLQKPFLFRLAYETAGGKHYKKFIEVAAALELLNISTYQANGSFDGKYGVNGPREHDNQFMAACLSREAITPLILNSKMRPKHKNLVLEVIAVIIRSVYEGQFLDLNKFQKNNGCLQMSLKEYLSLYLKRCFQLSGVFHAQTCMLGATLAEADKDQIDNLTLTGAYLGTALHIINDLSDFIPPDQLNNKAPSTYKLPEDQFNDIKNERVTLPIWVAFQRSNAMETGLIQELWSNESVINQLVEMVMEKGGVTAAYSVALALRNQAKRYLHFVQPSEARDFLSMMIGIIKTNKFLYRLRRISSVENPQHYHYLTREAMEQFSQMCSRNNY